VLFESDSSTYTNGELSIEKALVLDQSSGGSSTKTTRLLISKSGFGSFAETDLEEQVEKASDEFDQGSRSDKMLCLDTSFLIDYLHGRDHTLTFLEERPNAEYGVPTLALWELYAGGRTI